MHDDEPRLDDAIADGACRLISGPGNNRSTFCKTGTPCGAARHFAADLVRFQNYRQDSRVQRQPSRKLAGPSPVDDVEQRRARSIGDVTGILAGQLKAKVVLGKQHFSDTRKQLRFVVANPEQFGQCKTSQDRIGDRGENRLLADGCVNSLDLSLTALVAPDQRRSNDAIAAVEKRRDRASVPTGQFHESHCLKPLQRKARHGWRSAPHPTSSPGAVPPKAVVPSACPRAAS